MLPSVKWMLTKEAAPTFIVSLSFSPYSPPTATPLSLKLSYENLIWKALISFCTLAAICKTGNRVIRETFIVWIKGTTAERCCFPCQRSHHGSLRAAHRPGKHVLHLHALRKGGLSVTWSLLTVVTPQFLKIACNEDNEVVVSAAI